MSVVRGEILMHPTIKQHKKDRAMYIVCRHGEPYGVFDHEVSAVSWLNSRGAKQIQGRQFDNGFIIVDAPLYKGI